MKNLSFEQIRSLTKDSLIEELAAIYPFQIEKEFEATQHALFSFTVENMFAFSVYVPIVVNVETVDNLRVHWYESSGRGKEYRLLYPQHDKRFESVEWLNCFQKDPRSAAVVSPVVLLEMMKFAARLSRMKVFQ